MEYGLLEYYAGRYEEAQQKKKDGVNEDGVRAAGDDLTVRWRIDNCVWFPLTNDCLGGGVSGVP